MIAIGQFRRNLIDITGKPKTVVGLPDGVLKFRCRFRVTKIPLIFLRFRDRVQMHLLLCNGENLEPLERPEAVNYSSSKDTMTVRLTELLYARAAAIQATVGVAYDKAPPATSTEEKLVMNSLRPMFEQATGEGFDAAIRFLESK